MDYSLFWVQDRRTAQREERKRREVEKAAGDCKTVTKLYILWLFSNKKKITIESYVHKNDLESFQKLNS